MGAYWWDNLPGENLFMEITRRPTEEIGSDLRAPVSARGGVETSGYALGAEVGKASIVVHYDSTSEQIVGVSRASGERASEPIWWAARGSYARKAHVEPRWLPGLAVELEDLRRLEAPLTLDAIRERRDAILSLRDSLQVQHPAASLYYPWIPYRDTLRTFQTYLAKFPRAALDLLPELAEVVADIEGAPPRPAPGHPEIEQAERDLAAASGKPRPRKRASVQGFAVNQQVKVAVEAHAMNAARAHSARLGSVVDQSRTESFDYLVTIDGTDWHVEVKGTTGDGSEILLTPNEVSHAHDYPHVALFILANIEVSVGADGVSVAGGTPDVHHPWELNTEALAPLGYKYRVKPL